MAIILYARRSVERENSISCETQLAYCRSVIKPDEQDEKVFTFVDNGFSGGNVNRDGFQKMMKLVRQGKVKKVIVYKLDRISRSLSDFVNILQEFKEHRVEFVSSQESFDTSSPYGEMLVKLLMVFAEFERTSIINRVTQAYAHRSEMGFYMGGRRPYGFELIPTVIHNVKTKKLNPIPDEAEQVRYIFEAYARENLSLRRLQDTLMAEGKQPLNGSSWTTAKLSTLLKNPIYVKADSDVYDYYDCRGVQMVTDVSLFTGENGAQLYGHTKHDSGNADWSDMKLVLLTHPGIVSSGIWLKCQHKLEQNRKIGNSVSNSTSWLAGKVVCEKCGHTMTTIKGRINKVTIYAGDLEDMICECISAKLEDLKETECTPQKGNAAGINDLKLKIRAIERSEKQLLDAMLAGGFNDALLTLANQRAVQLERDRLALHQRIEAQKSRRETGIAVNLAQLWRTAGDKRKKAVAMAMIHKIFISEDGSTKVLWNL